MLSEAALFTNFMINFKMIFMWGKWTDNLLIFNTFNLFLFFDGSLTVLKSENKNISKYLTLISKLF